MNRGLKTANSNRIVSAVAGALLCLGCLIHPAAASADPGKHGDVNGDGGVDITDVMCTILVSLWELGDYEGDAPDCVDGPYSMADLDCSLSTSVIDVLLSIQGALEIPLGEEIDPDQNGCPNQCEASL